jgi:arsenate reductase
MAAAFFNSLANPGKARALSGGTRPSLHLHPVVLEAMKEVGLDLSEARPRRLSLELAATASLLITLGCGEDCPVIPRLERDDWTLEDPKGQSLERVRELRNEVRERVLALVQQRGWD